MSPVEVARGPSPVILAFPHTGTEVPPDVLERLNLEGRRLRDTDWHIHRLYDALLPGATTVRATFHRTVVDANRDPTGASLYPGQNTTALVPTTDFDGAPIWRDGAEPGAAEVADRVARFHAPYHAALAAEVARVKARHGIALVYDCHSIRSRVPFLFPGTLPDLNIGTDGGRTCDPALAREAVAVCGAAEGLTSVLDGRFRGGWTTRHYGRPETGVHAIQMELAQISHLATEAEPFALDEAKSRRVRSVLGFLLGRLAAVVETLKDPVP